MEEVVTHVLFLFPQRNSQKGVCLGQAKTDDLPVDKGGGRMVP